MLIIGIGFILYACRDKEEPVFTEEPEKPTITDIDGNVYDIVEFADNWWMVQNLRTSRYTNGEPIPEVADNVEWSEMETGAFSWFDNDPSLDTSYGKMYNWYAATCCSICPEGWRLPNDTDIKKVADRRLTPPMLSFIYLDAGWADDYTFRSGVRFSDGTFASSQIEDRDWGTSTEFTFKWGINASQPHLSAWPHGFYNLVVSSDEGTGYIIADLISMNVTANMGGYIRCVKIK
ncbi:FISUMP domain-containing protein [Cecembia lonarensis]|uniref:Fibrobacter succinogenes major paralogous domain-containing protein n=1 Tax=Cecembia lonarensis (strain CCUG 58316 / KCTC 22772 / LW9) TaxID=1225176 RepID=K1LCX7_CECL9|nr:FISUMP domain-containing protein [Cecembia lonarensis]EKB48233.1 hypothetical protein B879_03152 [Cecembia lonarensis LW9]